MSIRELIELFNRFVEEDLYKADALYYILLCWGCEGARLSYIIKYGSDYKYDQVIKELHNRNVMNIVGSICEISDIVIDYNIKFLEFFEEDTKSRIRYLSASSMKLLRVLYRSGLYESLARHDLGSIMYSSMMINSILRSMFKTFYELRKCISELVQAGLLVLCCIAPYEGLPHMYRVPKYSLRIWKNITKILTA